MTGGQKTSHCREDIRSGGTESTLNTSTGGTLFDTVVTFYAA